MCIYLHIFVSFVSLFFFYPILVPGDGDIPPKPTDAKLILFSDFPDYYEMEGRQGSNGLAHCTERSPQGQRMKCEVTVDNRRFRQADAVIFYTHGKTQMNDLDFVVRNLLISFFFLILNPRLLFFFLMVKLYKQKTNRLELKLASRKLVG